MSQQIVIERHLAAQPQTVFELWTTKEGIESWWAPDGFVVEVEKLEPRPGGELIYTFTATAPEQVQFMEGAGLPLTTRARKEFTEVVPGARLRYDSLVDFVPGVEPYEHDTLVELFSADADAGTRLVMTLEPLHDEEWTERIVMGRSNELDNLERLLSA
jgi:uncharacterized protein YndB with AHSA1/START domain